MFDQPIIQLSALTLMGLAILLGFYSGHLARAVRLPALIGYMILGILLGPSLLHLFDQTMMDNLSFLTNIALGFVAFSIGAELSLTSLKRLGPGIISVIFAESFGAFFLVFILVYALTRDLPLSLIFSAMAPASAPAGTVAVILETKSKGNLTKALYAIVGFDDGLAIIIFGFAAAFAKSLLIGEVTDTPSAILPALWAPTLEILLSVVVGGVVGILFCQMVRRLQNPRDMLIIVFGTVVFVTGLSLRWHLSLILTNMMVGFVLVNTRRETLVRNVTTPILEIMPLLFIVFFCIAGAQLDVTALSALGWLGLAYVVGRTVGKLVGVRVGAMLGTVDDNVKKYAGMGILNQAGVAIGLALIVNHEFSQLHLRHGLEEPIARAVSLGEMTITTVTATSVFFGIIGPIFTKIALSKAGEIPNA
jgi:Kef-type K+ transport system membrane component KefB